MDKSENILINLKNYPLDFNYYSLTSLAAANIEVVSIMSCILKKFDKRTLLGFLHLKTIN